MNSSRRTRAGQPSRRSPIFCQAPLLLWGPYLWIDGVTPRQNDGLVWTRNDCASDGTHPSPASGRDKVGKLLLQFFKNDPTSRTWFGK